MEKVLELQGDGIPSEWSWASPGTVALAPTPLPALTLCLHLLIPAYKASSTVISYATDTTDNFITVDVKTDNTLFCLGGTWTRVGTSLPPGSWGSLCLSYMPSDASWAFYTDGRLRETGYLRSSKGRSPPRAVAPSGYLVVGQDQDRFGGGFQADQSFRGLVARVRLWGRVLSPEEVARVDECTDDAGDGVVPWLTESWILNDTAEILQIPKEEICSKSGPYQILLSPAQPLVTAERLCSAIKADLAIPANREENDRLRMLVQDTDPSCYGGANQPLMWLGVSDAAMEGRWVDPRGTPTDFNAWAVGQPNGGDQENAAAMTGSGAWVDVNGLRYSYCSVCEAEEPIVLRALGLCQILPHDRYYVHEGHMASKPFFRGYSTSNISWVGGRWLASHPSRTDILLSYTPTMEFEHPFGRRAWVVKGAEGCGEGGSDIVITLTICSSGNFTCDDGRCVPMERKCDFQADCPDESDENDCAIVTLPGGYKSNVPPRSAHLEVAYPVLLHVTVLALEIKTEKMEIVMDFEVTLQWLDPRLVLNDLKEDNVINSLQFDVLKRLWIPEVSFGNAKGNAHTLLDEETKGTILRQGTPVPGDSTHSREVLFFAGSENPIQMARKYSATYSCSLDLALYPFDTQECSFTFLLTSAKKETLELQSVKDDLGVRYEGEWQLMEYTIDSFVILDKNHSQYSQKELVVHFRRRYGFAILTVYIPSTFFVSIAYLTTFFPISNVQVRVIIALTAMLVLTTLLNQVSAQLPRNSYFKVLDMWMFGAIGLIFAILIMQTVVDVIYRGEESPPKALTQVKPAKGDSLEFSKETRQLRALKMLKTMQIAFPVLSGFLVIAYTIYILATIQ